MGSRQLYCQTIIYLIKLLKRLVFQADTNISHQYLALLLWDASSEATRLRKHLRNTASLACNGCRYLEF